MTFIFAYYLNRYTDTIVHLLSRIPALGDIFLKADFKNIFTKKKSNLAMKTLHFFSKLPNEFDLKK